MKKYAYALARLLSALAFFDQNCFPSINHFYISCIEETKRYGAMIKACHIWYQIVDEI